MSSDPAMEIFSAIQDVIGQREAALHEPTFGEQEEIAVLNSIRSGYVSSIGQVIETFEEKIKEHTGAQYAVAVVNGTAALATALISSGVNTDEEVLLPSLTFVGTANAILHARAMPHFVDSEPFTLGINTHALDLYLEKCVKVVNGKSINKHTGRIISAIVPVHVFGIICEVEAVIKLAQKYNLVVVEDAAEALGAKLNGRHAGLFGKSGILSFNGNKIITTGGGGAIITNDEKVARRARHLTTTAKIPHQFEYFHDQTAYNYRMPALNAALGFAQIDRLEQHIQKKKMLALAYMESFSNLQCCKFYHEHIHTRSNNWLNSIRLTDIHKKNQKQIIASLNEKKLGCRPIWSLLSDLPHLVSFPKMEVQRARELQETTICIPSSPSLVIT